MFQVIRESLGTALRLRGKRLAGLFAFEFVVVLLGVLAAQAVQNWAQERERLRRAEEERVRLEQGFIAAVDMGKVWRAALPCLRERVGEIMRAAGSGASVSEELSRRPKFPQSGYEGTTPEDYARIAALHGDEQASALADVQGRLTTVQNAGMEVRSQWELFRLLDPQFGPIAQN
jgi:hypothetical protein